MHGLAPSCLMVPSAVLVRIANGLSGEVEMMGDERGLSMTKTQEHDAELLYLRGSFGSA